MLPVALLFVVGVWLLHAQPPELALALHSEPLAQVHVLFVQIHSLLKIHYYYSLHTFFGLHFSFY
jgi:hypothetical protein